MATFRQPRFACLRVAHFTTVRSLAAATEVAQRLPLADLR